MHDMPAPAAERWPAAGALRRDLLTAAARPLPPLGWPRRLRWLPQAAVVLAAVALAATGADLAARLLAVAHAATLVVALRRPALACWLSGALFVGIAVGHPPSPPTTCGRGSCTPVCCFFWHCGCRPRRPPSRRGPPRGRGWR
ncbi:hypothetical protein [Streptomyces sp. G45]|uniref:hypothetical protein n=1 Tax=Streptomyces sp. G45 TaxID=3406627 RepID=UPI003C29F682